LQPLVVRLRIDGLLRAVPAPAGAFPQAVISRIKILAGHNIVELAQVYKQLNAPLGLLGRKSLIYANRSITGGDAVYARYLDKIGAVTTERDALAGQIKAELNNAAFANKPVGEGGEDGLGERAQRLIDKVEDLAERDERFGE
jgi:hypothetical protein